MTNGMVFCRGCGKQIHSSAQMCPHCGAPGASHAAAHAQPLGGDYAAHAHQNAWQQSAGAPQGTPDLRAMLPMPPRLHWGLVLLFACLSFGIFGWVWCFMQANWTKRIDPKNNATMYFIGAAVSSVLFGISMILVQAGGSDLIDGIGTLFSWVSLGLTIAGFFTIGKSLRERLPQYGYHIEINNVMLFFFTGLYVQSKLTALALWKETGFAGYGQHVYQPPVAAAPVQWPGAQAPAPIQPPQHPVQPPYAPAFVPPPAATPVPQPVVEPRPPEAPAPQVANVVRYDAQGNRIP
ncbi:MAG: hypothetical protein QM612_04725 [Thermomonas sp.]|uniref:hypothetical protein n=1 Tax=Thermomonas sp. TaxID=1971895 RepID=UPI0039E3B686